MKKIIIFILTILCVLNVNAQELKFMGIPVNNTIENIHRELITKKRFHIMIEGTWFNLYKGEFYGREVDVRIRFTWKEKKVSNIDVIFTGNGESAEELYENLAKDLTQKYDETGMIPRVSKNVCVWLFDNLDSIHLEWKNSNSVVLSYINDSNTRKWSDEALNKDNIKQRKKERLDDL